MQSYWLQRRRFSEDFPHLGWLLTAKRGSFSSYDSSPYSTTSNVSLRGSSLLTTYMIMRYAHEPPVRRQTEAQQVTLSTVD